MRRNESHSPEKETERKVHTEVVTRFRPLSSLPCSNVEHIDEVVWTVPSRVGDSLTSTSDPKHEKKACQCVPGLDPKSGNLTCCSGLTCKNRSSYIECTEENCSNGALCMNRQIGKKRWREVVPFYNIENGKGMGLRITGALRKGEFIIEYVGEVRKREDIAEEDDWTYIMELEEGIVIDAQKKGGLARYINHSCDPNCVFNQWKVGSLTRVAIFAKKDVRPGEELTYDYNWEKEKKNVVTRCLCASSNCRGTLEAQTSPRRSSRRRSSVAAPEYDNEKWEDWREFQTIASKNSGRVKSPKPHNGNKRGRIKAQSNQHNLVMDLELPSDISNAMESDNSDHKTPRSRRTTKRNQEKAVMFVEFPSDVSNNTESEKSGGETAKENYDNKRFRSKTQKEVEKDLELPSDGDRRISKRRKTLDNSALLGSAHGSVTKESEETDMNEKEKDKMYGGTTKKTNKALMSAKAWDSKFKMLEAFKTTRGHCHVPKVYPSNASLSHWVQKVRKEYKLFCGGNSSYLSTSRVKKLEEIDFIFDGRNLKSLQFRSLMFPEAMAMRQDKWDTKFNMLVEFKRKSGHCNVPKNFPSNSSLACWVQKQRKEYKEFQEGYSSYPNLESNIQRLQEVGFIFDGRKFRSKTERASLCNVVEMESK